MPLTCTNVAAASFASTTGGDPVAIPSHTTVADRLYTFGVVSSINTALVSSVTLAGTGTEVILGNRARGALLNVTVGYMLCTAGGTGVGSIDLSEASTGCCFSLDEWTGFDPADPVIDANYQEGDWTDASGPADWSITLPNALQKATNAIWGCMGANVGGAPQTTPGTDYTETFDAVHATPARTIFTQYDISPADLVFDGQCTNAAQGAVCAFEINEDASRVPRHPAINHQNPALLMERMKRRYRRAVSGLFVPQYDDLVVA